MNYSKPELIQLGRATDAVQSVLEKGSREWDSMQGEPFLTTPSAYQADE
jgi:hypothetical protein